MADTKQPKQPNQPPSQPAQGPRKLNEDTAALTSVRGGYTVTNDRPAPTNPHQDSGGKDDKK